MDLTVLHPRSGKVLESFKSLPTTTTIDELKREFVKRKPKYYADRQSYRSDKTSRALPGDKTLGSLANGAPNLTLYFKDLGPQIGWSTVFVAEYSGPLLVYLLLYMRPAVLYGTDAASVPRHWVAQLACVCWVGHYAKRLIETLFVHRFSHGTMPMRNLFKNCSYYWGFAGFVAYFINHPLYTPPMYGDKQALAALAGFLFCQLGNFSIHIALRNLRPSGSKQRKIPMPTANPFTWLFGLVSCPNYTYEIGSWIAFTIMCQSVPAGMFALAGGYQMLVWALGKHRNYKREFPSYPRGRKAIVPFVL